MRFKPGIVYSFIVGMYFLAIPGGQIMASSEQPNEPHGTEVLTFEFGGMDYLHRWSKDGQNEFTPQNDGNLAAWRDMITINVHKETKNGDQLAELAEAVLSNYQNVGKILRADSKPGSDNQPAEPLIVAVLGDSAFLEAVFARFILIDGVGTIVVYSHRAYGEQAGLEMSQWLEANGPQVEKRLMSWDKVPPIAALMQLPQSSE